LNLTLEADKYFRSETCFIFNLRQVEGTIDYHNKGTEKGHLRLKKWCKQDCMQVVVIVAWLPTILV